MEIFKGNYNNKLYDVKKKKGFYRVENYIIEEKFMIVTIKEIVIITYGVKK